MRKINVSTPGSNLQQSIESNARTWGQLKEELSQNGINTDGMKGVTEETRNTLESSDAVLPEGEFTVHLFTAKIKSGNGIDMAQLMSDLQAKLNDAFNELIEDIENGVYGNGSVERQVYDGASSRVASIRKDIEESLQ